MSHALLVTVPNNKDSASNTFRTIAPYAKERDLSRPYRFETPDLVVGTLDSLMVLSDELNKIGLQVENVVKKIERQYYDTKDESSNSQATTPSPLKINDLSVESFLSKFQWDLTLFQYQGKNLTELVTQINNMANKLDDELKLLINSYNEKLLNYTTNKKKKVINLSVNNFEDFLKPNDIKNINIMNSEFLVTVMIVVPKALEQTFLQEYEKIGDDIAAYGGPDWDKGEVGSNDGKFGKKLKRTKVKGSPIVPGSHKKVFEDSESVLYSIVVLRGHYQSGEYDKEDNFVNGVFCDYIEPLRNKFKEKKYTLREFSYDSNKVGELEESFKTSKSELKQATSALTRWCKVHYSEVYLSWIHLKVIQGFVESVLRYGLPVDYLFFFALYDEKNEKELKHNLLRSILSHRPQLKERVFTTGPEEEEEDDFSTLPFVALKFPLIGATPITPSN